MLAKQSLVCVLLITHCLGAQKPFLVPLENKKTLQQIAQSIQTPNSCFRYIPNVKMKIKSEHIGGTESIQFKDECLKACLRSQIQHVFTCRSLFHIPRDDDCLLMTTNMNHTDYERNNDFPLTNYYENLCALSPYGEDAVLTEARFNGFKGGEGIIKFAQKYDNPTKALLIFNGVHENTELEVLYYQQSTSNCYKLKEEEVARAKYLLRITTDLTGMAVVPWIEVDIDQQNILGTLILIIDADYTVVECAYVRPFLTDHESTTLTLTSSDGRPAWDVLRHAAVFPLILALYL